MPEGTFEVRGLFVRYGDRAALSGVSCEVHRAETLVLLGQSGSGKSTLLKALIGLAHPSAGEVRLLGEAVTAQRAAALRTRVGYVVQGGGLFPHLSARQNVALPARHAGWSPARISERIIELLALTQLPADALERHPSQLSGGQAQRVSLMRALILDPDVLLLDEPLGALDPITRFELQAQLRAVFSRLQKTVVLVTHDLSEAIFFASRIALFRDGQLVQLGTFEELERAPADPFVSRFLTAQRGLMGGAG